MPPARTSARARVSSIREHPLTRQLESQWVLRVSEGEWTRSEVKGMKGLVSCKRGMNSHESRRRTRTSQRTSLAVARDVLRSTLAFVRVLPLISHLSATRVYRARRLIGLSAIGYGQKVTTPSRYPRWVKLYSLVFERGSLGPSTVTLIAFDKVATCGGDVCSMIVRVKLFPENENERRRGKIIARR